MTQLEQAIAERARAHLEGVQAFYAKAKAGTTVEDDLRDYRRNHAAMGALLELRHWRDSGMARRAVMPCCQSRLRRLRRCATTAHNDQLVRGRP